MKSTYLEIVQQLLSELESDEVVTLNETVESELVTRLVKQVYFHIISGSDWPHLGRLLQLEVTTTDNVLKFPSNLNKLSWIKYNKKKVTDLRERFTIIKKLEPLEFMNKVDARDNTKSNITPLIHNGMTILLRNDKQPEYWTSFNDNEVIFDSFDSVVEAKLDALNTQVFGFIVPSVTTDDLFVFDLPEDAFQYFINEARSFVFNVVKQIPFPKAEQMAQTQRRRLSKQREVGQSGDLSPNFGRRSSKSI